MKEQKTLTTAFLVCMLLITMLLSSTTYVQANGTGGLSIGNDTTICAGSCITLSSNISGTYLWSTGATTSSITVCPAGNTTVTLQVTSGATVYNASMNITVDKYGVWPGDADNNGVVDGMDVLNIGLAYGSTGPARANASASWAAQHADNWNSSFSRNSINYKYADCNGDGIINSDDLAAITANWSGTHQKTEDTILNVDGNTQLYMVTSNDTFTGGDTVTFKIYLGSPTSTATVYGIEFSYQLAPGTAENGSMALNVNPTNCWLYGTDGSSAVMSYLNPNYTNDVANVAISRTFEPAQTGYGQIGVLTVVVADNVSGKQNFNGPKTFYFSQAAAVDGKGDIVNVNGSKKTMYLENKTLGIKATLITDKDVDIYPNPVAAGNALNIGLKDVKAQSLMITDLLGNTVYSNVQPMTGNTQLQMPNLAAGMYVVHIASGNSMITHKISITN